MKTLLRKCTHCASYTLKQVCNRCNSKTIIPIPARFSPEDRYGKYRRLLKHSNA
ncbi:MAG: RNA-protein complex protein Nop10 [Candidatus Thermoplasmatota archaeon]